MRFPIDCPDPPGESLCGSGSLARCISSILRLESLHCSLVHGLQNGCCVSRQENSMNLVRPHQSSWVTRRLVSEQSHSERNLCFLSSRLNTGLKISSEPCCKRMGCHPGFVVPFTEHRQSTFSVILKIQGFSECPVSAGFNLKPPVALAPDESQPVPGSWGAGR